MKKHRNRKHRSKREKIGILTLIFINLLFFFTSVKSFAAEANWYINNMEILSQNNWGISVFRKIGWGLIKIAVRICDAAETLYDKAFDIGLISFSNDRKVLLSTKLKSNIEKEYYSAYFAPIEGKKLIEPMKYNINTKFLEWHRDYIFKR